MDFLSVISLGACSLALSAVDKFFLHMLLPVILSLALCASLFVSLVVHRGNQLYRQNRINMIIKAHVMLAQLMYVGLSQRIFTLLRCRDIEGVGSVLALDYYIDCNSSNYVMYTVFAYIFMVVYIIGLPAFLMWLLFQNRKHLYADDVKHVSVRYYLSGIFSAYKPEYYQWEMVVMFQKAMMTGAFAVLEPGSPTQLLSATLFMLGYNLALKFRPYIYDFDSRLAASTALAIFLTALSGFCLVTDHPYEQIDDKAWFDSVKIGELIIALNLLLPFSTVLYSIWLYRRSERKGILVVPRTHAGGRFLLTSEMVKRAVTKHLDKIKAHQVETEAGISAAANRLRIEKRKMLAGIRLRQRLAKHKKMGKVVTKKKGSGALLVGEEEKE